MLEFPHLLDLLLLKVEQLILVIAPEMILMLVENLFQDYIQIHQTHTILVTIQDNGETLILLEL
ncbi:MAG: hypothetical protein EBR82_80310 [Caulobacteraceae bacterium]|nr:hypothetical protein [Caulobacteraceae bacterium]